MNMLPSPPEPAIAKGEMQALKLSTSDIPPAERAGWLREVICREYANVDVTSPVRQTLSQDLTIYPFDSLRLSVIRSSGIGLKRRPFEPHLASHDAYLAIVLLSGDYVLEQDGNEAVLQPGDLDLRRDPAAPHPLPGGFRQTHFIDPASVAAGAHGRRRTLRRPAHLRRRGDRRGGLQLRALMQPERGRLGGA